MGLSSKINIGPYQVRHELGRGGMGEVYLAHDTRLDRPVAIKALPEHLAADPDRLARFQREAKILASLNHSGIGAIFGLEESAGRHYLILEFVEGRTLSQQFSGPVPIPEALSIVRQIAEALEAAHEKGVVHRDLKPGNVMVTPDGAVKVLDFGIARTQVDPATAGPLSPDSPTITSPALTPSPTIAGAIMGSPGYMSPEQALGKAVDKRSDIFAFGCVLYELLAGVQAFPGENVTDSLGAILHREPDWSRLPESTPARIRDLLVSLLHKDRKQRLHDIGDARLVLERTIQGQEWVARAQPARRPATQVLPWALMAALLVVAAAALWRPWATPRGIEPSRSVPIRLRADVPEAPPGGVEGAQSIAISPDGTQIAYLSAPSEQDRFIAVRRLDDSVVRRLTSPSTTPGLSNIAMDTMFSPDGKYIAGFQAGSLYVIPVAGGDPTRLYTSLNTQAKGCAWVKNGILFSPAPNAGLLLISEMGGEPQQLTVPDAARGEISHRYPDVLPGDHKALITIKKADILTFDDAEIALLDLETKTWKTIIRGGSFARYAPTGHIVFARNGSIMAVPFDAASGQVTGTPVAVVPDVTTSPSSGVALFALARDTGTLAYVPGGPDDPRRELIWVGMDGKVEPVGAPIMGYTSAALSPDGTRIATSVWGASDAVFVYDLARRTNTRVTFRGNCGDPKWMPDGTQVAYRSDADGPTVINLVNADGSGNPELVIDSGGNTMECLATIDGIPGAIFGENGDIWIRPFHAGSPQQLVGSQFTEISPRVSPDGRWLSYASNESGQYEVYVRPFPSGSGRWQVSIGGGRQHFWMPDGGALVYMRDRDRAVQKVRFQSQPAVQFANPDPMFVLPSDCVYFLEATSDGQKFLTIRQLPAKFSVEQVCVVLNWFEELKAKVPTGSR